MRVGFSNASPPFQRLRKFVYIQSRFIGQNILYNPVVEQVFQKSQVYYNIFGQEAGQPVRLPSVSCLSYNKRDNWPTRQDLGVCAREQDCPPSSYCSVRFKQVELP